MRYGRFGRLQQRATRRKQASAKTASPAGWRATRKSAPSRKENVTNCVPSPLLPPSLLPSYSLLLSSRSVSSPSISDPSKVLDVSHHGTAGSLLASPRPIGVDPSTALTSRSLPCGRSALATNLRGYAASSDKRQHTRETDMGAYGLTQNNWIWPWATHFLDRGVPGKLFLVATKRRRNFLQLTHYCSKVPP